MLDLRHPLGESRHWMQRARQFAILAFLAFLVPAGPAATIEALFLGDRGHHEPEKRFSWIEATLAAAGIHATYTEDLAALTSENLARYDVLMVYANITAVSADQERALLGFVESGHGFVPIHCASACFGTSPALVALTGARFKSHDVAVFAPVIIDHDHPIMRGFAGYECWDETYVHADHNERDRTVLAVREENGVREPWTWVRTQGKGRVFYTASGHDERAWNNQAFRELLVRGTAWAAGEKGRPILDAIAGNGPAEDPGRPPLRYEARPSVQNYEQRAPYPKYQLPLSSADSMRYTHVEPGFELQLFASEPDIVKPIAFTWDHRGRLFVLESVDYPSTFTDQWHGHDRIVICEDTKGSGRADTFTVFADGLNIATGLAFVNGGIVVVQAPNLLFLKDTDGDDKADVKEVVMTGWSKGDTHAGPSSLHYGFDNRIYGSVGYSGFSGEVGGNRVSFRSGPFRFDRAYTSLEFLGQYSNNTWGMAFNEAGELFGSTANNAHHYYTPIPIPCFAGVKGMEGNERFYQATKMDAHYAAHPLTDKIRQVDVFGGFTAAAGQNLYTARAFPERYWDRCALVNEPTMHLLHQGFLKREGSGWTEDGDGRNLLASEEQWVAPVHAEVGPDGAVWVADWYNFIIQHNPTPSRDHGGFDTTTGLGGAHENALRDHERGRIYRIIWKEAKPKPPLALDPADAVQLVAELGNDNLFWRLTAQRLLVERGKRDVVPALIARVGDQGCDSVGVNGGVIHALWTLHGLGCLDGSDPAALAAAVGALRHPSQAVRRNAVQVLPPSASSARALLASGILGDEDLNVRLAAFLASATMPVDAALGAALFAQSQRAEIMNDRNLPVALRLAAAHHALGFLAAEVAAGTRLPAPVDVASAPAGPVDFPNAGFEEVAGGQPTGWVQATYGGAATFAISPDGRTGRCVSIASDTGADVGWKVRFPVKANTLYRFSGWVKTSDVTGAMGALFNLQGRPPRSPAINGTRDWTRLSMDFDSEGNTSLEINCLFGGWGESTGTAWYDDLGLVELGHSTKSDDRAPGETERVVSRNAGYLPLVEQDALLTSLVGADAGFAAAVLDGLIAAWTDRGVPKDAGERERQVLMALVGGLPQSDQRRLGRLAECWRLREGLPGIAGAPPEKAQAPGGGPTPLAPEQQKRFESGRNRYLTLCIACHQVNGLGLPAVAPPLVGSDWVNGPESRLARIVLNGVKGPIQAAGSAFSLEMPPLRDALDDTAIAEILTYVRHEWGNDAAPVETRLVTAIRAADQARKVAWTAEELQSIP